ncbi:RNA polymerase-associated protein RapA [Alteromonas sediminis]|uniref:RNA polymerase-associated protein RapA n=1 Tax=Alteromonas sediminis TaxID=2259342 RepID=A0A3N5Z9N2_9ALTE|nr:RNA polymerase-associated protein RapA [Alteromonas sediminis]RPJ66028.1 RNA polymerase-associated protein RapA [Alteromonas sediminis]
MSKTNLYSTGQRWLSNTEGELGLGIVTSVDFRTIEVLFPAANDSRLYTKNDAPLTRFTLSVGDVAKSADGWQLAITEVLEQDGLLIYSGIREDDKSDALLPETQLDHSLQIDKPEQRLFNLQLDSPKWFDLRLASWQQRHSHATSPVCGLTGARISLIPHQLYIASEVATRYAPRVLLADEVGLGKTIEAALIIHQQLLTHRAQRVLIVVPDSLVHQWLVEMLRRVNLAFSLFDESRWEAMTDDDNELAENPFDSEQLVLCSTSFLTASEKRLQACAKAGWDLVVVDEAHHLVWSEDSPSEAYRAVELLSAHTKGLVLLTATPDQLGHESHFARLRLLDPDRFYDYAAFLEEEKQYSALADAVLPLLSNDTLAQEDIERLQTLAPEVLAHHPTVDTPAQRDALLHQLIDCHGTGRLLFRNRRANIEGFPQRHLFAHPLPAETGDYNLRVQWLIEHVEQLKPEKVLLICQHAETAIALGETLRTKTGIRYTVFHEGMSIVERDKSAHYFADPEQGAQIMLCSEIGSEGRNFQFAHNLVLFDLPESPDLLEQRIGRLDRIGQTKDVNIHVPFVPNSRQATLLKWYHDGLNAFEETCPTGRAVSDKLGDVLEKALNNPADATLVNQLVDESHALNSTLKAQLEAGRDRLLELSASGLHRVDPLLDAIVEQDTSPVLARLMGRLFDAIGVQQEERDSETFILTPTETMVNHLPGLDPDGMTVTYRRNTATALEHVHFLSWDHPLVHSALDTVLLDVHGKSAMGFMADLSLPKGAYWVEAVFLLQVNAPAELQVDRYLPPTPIRVVIDANGQACDLTFDVTRKVPRKMAKQLIGALQTPIEHYLATAKQRAHQIANQCQHDALVLMNTQVGGEVQRLRDLRQTNPSVRESEIVYFEQQQAALSQLLKDADIHLDAVRVVINNP